MMDYSTTSRKKECLSSPSTSSLPCPWYSSTVQMVSELVSLFSIGCTSAESVGWSTQIPNYNPLEIVENLQRLMKGEEVEKMTPWFRGFKVCPLLTMVADRREPSRGPRPTSTRSAVSLTRLMIPPSRLPSCPSESGLRTSRRCWRR